MVKRYDLVGDGPWPDPIIYIDEKEYGDYVSYSDYERLESALLAICKEIAGSDMRDIALRALGKLTDKESMEKYGVIVPLDSPERDRDPDQPDGKHAGD